MIPSILSRQIHQGLKDFLSTTFHSTNPFFHGMLDDFLVKQGNLSKGPYISLQLPFQTGQSRDFFPEIPLGYLPYKHQELAFVRLAQDNPPGTIIATGTGSGKTECFTLPILEYCRVNHDQPGIKAIFIYPMNALAFDQAGRLAKTIWNTPGLRGKVTAGLFIGQSSSEPCAVMGQESIITDKEILRQSPPDILLTNYKMLDYLLIRAQDAVIWDSNAPETLRFIVVDELHTFDGAQGTDLACLIRRLKSRLGTPENHLCPIGTSATLGHDQSRSLLIDYAGRIFGEPFDESSVITEHRQSTDEFLRGELISFVEIPGVELKQKLSQEEYSSPQEFLKAQIKLWTGMDLDLSWDESQWKAELGFALKGHVFVHNLLRVVDGRPCSLEHIINELGAKASPQLKKGGKEYAELLMSSLLACISSASSGTPDSPKPFIYVRIQHWFRELRRMVCSVQKNPQLAFADDLTAQQCTGYLPLLHCRECGQTGWIGRLPIHGSTLQTDRKSIYVDFFRNKPSKRLISMFPEEDGGAEGFSGHKMTLCPECLQLGIKNKSDCSGCGNTEIIPVLIPDSIGKHCPSCGAHNSLTLLGSRSASLISVMIGQLMASKYNYDTKCIAFSDNVQDAAHRAGFFGARTFRFTLRTALQQFVQSLPQALDLKEISTQMPAYWQDRLDAETFAATFLPPNMAWLESAEYLEKHDHLPAGSDLCRLISRRLRFEIVSEYGFGSRIGRTLEKSGASIVGPDPVKLSASYEMLKQVLPDELEEMRGKSLDLLPEFIMGLITQMKNQGAVVDPDLNEYVKSWGKEFMISQKRKLWMPSFGPKTRTPGFITTRPGMGRFPQLIKSGSRCSWYEWWAFTHFPELSMGAPALSQRFYDLLFFHLQKQGLVLDFFQDGHHIFGLEPQSLIVFPRVVQFKCSTCGHNVSGSETDSEIWTRMHCLRRGCRGEYVPAFSGPDYYGRLYKNGRVLRLVAREHTGLLEREVREELERKFKASDKDRKPWYPNLLSSTPTLEMGIDIGDLETTLQCSVPPSQANYIQRIGRSGRKTGNGLNLTVAAGKAHDLYFFAQTMEMISGRIHPPGVFLDASAVLERQFTAFCMDRWISSHPGDELVPKRLGSVLDIFQQVQKKVFPHNLIHFIQQNLDKHLEDFLLLFREELSQDSINHLKTFARGDNQDNPGLSYRMLQRLYELHKERKSLKIRIDRLYREIKRKQAGSVKDKNYQQELDELKRERSGLMALVRNINSKNTYNFFTDEGLLPNYAFPEQGILLQSIIYRRRQTRLKGQGQYETINFEYERPAGSGLRELAPGNRFYAEGRRVEVDQVDLSVAAVEAWRLCANCPHSQPEVTAKDTSTCPRCGSPLWNDQGRKQELVRVRQVMANAPDRETRIGDDSDERNPAFYATQLLIDIDSSGIQDAYQTENPQCPFGFEFISKAVFRDINFGPAGDNRPTLKVAGEDLEQSGFMLCRHCGKVQKSDGKTRHAFGCPAREKQDSANFVKSVFLYREFTSEAIKILVPVSGSEISRRGLDSFVAALQLGLKHHFGGSSYAIQHLQTTLSQEPVPDSNLRKQYVVLFDSVPGGTGFLKQLMRSENMIKVLQKALDVLTSCPCRKDPEKDGCYSCLFAYRHSYLMPTTSRQTAMDMLKDILNNAHFLRRVKDLQGIRVDGLGESELEVLFLKALSKPGTKDMVVELRKELVRGKPGSFLILNNRAYEIEPQVELGSSRNIMIPSRADFVIWPATSTQSGQPVAIFTDGLSFHRRRIGQDMAQRLSILQSRKFLVWSLSWKDVNSQVRNTQNRVNDLLHPGDSIMGVRQFVALLEKLKLQDHKEWHLKDSFDLLMQYMAGPDTESFKKYALAQALTLLDLQKFKDMEQKKDWLRKLEMSAPDFFVREIEADLGQSLVGILSSGPIKLFVAARSEALQKCDPAGIRVLCRLDDDEQSLEREDFESSWINFLRLMNIFQFLPGSLFVTTNGLRQGLYAGLHSEDISTDLEHSVQTTWPASEESDWKEVFELAHPQARNLLLELHGQGRPAPEVGYELFAKEQIAEAELAWSDDKIAYFTESGKDEAELFKSQGWQVFMITAQMNPEHME